MSATAVIALRDPKSSAAVRVVSAKPGAAQPPPLPSMRVPKGSASPQAVDEDDDWDGLVAQAKARDDDEWEVAVAAAKARVERARESEDKEWQEALARAKRIAQIGQSTQPKLPPQRARPPRPKRMDSGVVLKAAVAPREDLDDAEWRMLRQQADQRARQERVMAAPSSHVFAPAAVLPRPAPRVVAWP